jgi:hypothetical protein
MIRCKKATPVPVCKDTLGSLEVYGSYKLRLKMCIFALLESRHPIVGCGISRD